MSRNALAEAWPMVYGRGVRLELEIPLVYPEPSSWERRRAYEGGSAPTLPEVRVVGVHRTFELAAGLVEVAGRPVVVELQVRRLRKIDPKPWGGIDASEEEIKAALEYQLRESKDGYAYAEPVRELTARELRRLPIDRFLASARAMAGVYFRRRRIGGPIQAEEMLEELRRVRAPRGRPRRGRSSNFYAEIAEFYRAAVAQGKRPGAEIARRKGVDANLARQWIYRARKLGFLEPVEEER
jgi:hypothetical protein